jgi:16S rRNA (cytosine1402-N4)-methyltransferase
MAHIPVLKNEILDQFGYLTLKKKVIFVDGTLGCAGHSLALTKMLTTAKVSFRLIGIDQDQNAIIKSKKVIDEAKLKNKFVLVHDNFKNINGILSDLDIQKIDGGLLDLGVSSSQFDNGKRGFSFKDNEQFLDMRMDQSKKLDAKYVLNNYSEIELERILRQYGEERFSRKIAHQIVYCRKAKRIEKIHDLLEILRQSIPKKMQFTQTHFATKVFQALRIEVNSELEILEQSIEDFVTCLNPGGRLAIITFHSLEDRIVKHTLNKLANPCGCPPKMPCICGKKPSIKIITKKPILPKQDEIVMNNRSRSAKLRVVEKL